MRRFGAYFGVLFGAAGALNGLLLMLFGERALPIGRNRVPASRDALNFLSNEVHTGLGTFVEGALWLVFGGALAVFCLDLAHPFLPRRDPPLPGAPPRDPVAEALFYVEAWLKRLSGWRLSLAVAVPVAIIAWMFLNLA